MSQQEMNIFVFLKETTIQPCPSTTMVSTPTQWFIFFQVHTASASDIKAYFVSFGLFMSDRLKFNGKHKILSLRPGQVAQDWRRDMGGSKLKAQ